MRVEGSFLQSKVARRVFALFVLSALVPVAFLSVFSYYQVTRLLTEQTQRELAVFSSGYGTAASERLLLADRTLGNVALEMTRDLAAAHLQKLSSPIVRSLVRVSPSGERKIVFGSDFQTGKAGVLDQEHLKRGEALLEITPSGKGASSVVIVRLIDAATPAKGWIAAEVNPVFLWGSDEELPYQTSICVLDARNEPLHCSSPDIQHAMVKTAENIAGRGVRGSLKLTAGKEAHLAVVREVFVASKFGKHYWAVIASRPEAAVLAPVSVFSIIFWGSVILSALVVMLLSVSQIRRTMIPLESLMAAARRVANRDFSTPVQVRRGDEFGDLADTFNYMTTRLDRQFNVLSALSRIDRSILSDLNVTAVVEEVLSRLPEMVKADFSVIFVLKHDSDRDGEMHFASTAHGRQKLVEFTMEDAMRQ